MRNRAVRLRITSPAAALAAFIALGLSIGPSAADQVSELSSALEGRFDNELQVFFDADQKPAPAPERKRAHWTLRKHGVGNSLNVTVAESSEATEARAYIFGLTEAKGGIDMSIAAGDAKVFDCTVTWTKDGNAFKGALKGPECAELFSGPLSLTQNRLEIGRSDNRLADQFRRARPFECWVAVLRGAKHGDEGKGAKDTDWFFKRGVWLHDQGGLATIKTDETPARELRLRLRRVAWPSGPNRPSLTLYVLGEKDDRAVSYAWGEFDAERLGVNLRWMQASCTYAPEKLWPQ